MSNNKNIYKLINFGAALAATVMIISVSVTLTVLTRPIYYLDIKYLNIPQMSGISAEACRLNYDTLIDYNLLGGTRELIFPTLPMSEEGRIHFEEVRDIFTSMQMICIAGIIVLMVWILYVKRKNLEDYNHTAWMRMTGIVTVTVAAAVAVAIAIDWQWAFTVMHKMFFNNDYWIFDPVSDPVIRILPDKFFMHCGIFIIVLTVIQIASLELIYRRINRCRK